MNRLLLLSVALLAVPLLLVIPRSKAAPFDVEVGPVAWGRDLDGALKQSGESGKPVLVLFQEVPGCAGCQDFGKTVLTHPLLIEAIEDEFIPVLVYNNRGGEDRKTLNRFGEPAWNFQVIRYLDAEGGDVVPRKDLVWTLGGTAARMAEALTAASRPVPKYLRSLAGGTSEKRAEAAIAQYCFWTGEATVGKIDGVVSTEAGFFGGHEVTKVVYDPERVDLAAVVRGAAATQRVDGVYVPAGSPVAGVDVAGVLDAGYRAAPRSDQLKQLTGYEKVLALPGLTEMQKTRLNALIRTDRAAALAWLSPRQRAVLEKS